MKSKSNTVPGKMQLPRALELLNAIIDCMIEREGGHANRAVPILVLLSKAPCSTTLFYSVDGVLPLSMSAR